jgi:surface antigen
VRSKSKKLPKASVLATYAAVFALIVSFVAIGYRQPQQAALASTSTTSAAPAATSSAANLEKPSVDELVATDIAANLATSTDMSVAKNVAELSVSLAAKSDLSQTNDAAISKPQIIQLSSTGHTVTTYKAKAGDTAQTIAAANHLTADTIKWSNNLTSDAVEPNRDVVILPIDGVLYTPKAGDTAASIAALFHADPARIVPFNDLEITGIVPGQQIIVPGGIMPDNMRPGAAAAAAARAAAAGNSFGYNNDLYTVNSGLPTSTTNGYAYGYCTWYAFERRMQLGRPVGGNWGNASSWAAYARAAGYRVDHTPEVGAVMQNGGGAGHVAIVEQVLPDGSVVLSEMNYAGNWNRVTKGRVVSAGQAASYNFIH